MSEEKIPDTYAREDLEAESSSTKYECPIHGVSDYVGITVLTETFKHEYCLVCFDLMLQRHCQMVKEVVK